MLYEVITMNVKGSSDIARSQTRFDALLEKLQPKTVNAEIKHLDLPALLYMAAQPHYFESGSLDMRIRIDDATPKTLQGNVSTRITQGSVDPLTTAKAFELDPMPPITFTLNTDSQLNKTVIASRVDLNASLMNLGIKSARFRITSYNVCYTKLLRGSYKWILNRGITVAWDREGNPLRMIGTYSDIDDRKMQAEALVRSENELNEAQRLAKIGNWRLDLIQNHLEWSDEIYAIFEIDATLFQPSYESFLEAIHPEDRDLVNKAYSQSVETGQPYEITHRLLFENDRIKYVIERGETLYDEFGKPRITSYNVCYTKLLRLEIFLTTYAKESGKTPQCTCTL